MATKISQRIKAAIAQNTHAVKKRGRAIKSFADKAGLIYFGSIDRKRDDIEIIRGVTASTTHRDMHYAVGTYDEYDAQITDRLDVFVDQDNKSRVTHWTIIQIDLKSISSLPHIFLYPTATYNPAFGHLFSAFNGLQPINSLLDDQHTPEFHNRYHLYVAPSQATYIERFFSRNITQIFASHFWPHAVELIGDKVYLYDTSDSITSEQLGALLKLAVWVAATFDSAERQLD